MSRAFVDETDDNLFEDDFPEIKDPLPPGVKNYMTPDGAERLKSELHHLMKVERPNLSAALSRAVTDGEASKKELMGKERRRLRAIDRRVEYLAKMVGKMEVVDIKKQDPEQVLFGARVTIIDEGDKKMVYQIVGIDESDPSRGRISWISPVARALVNTRIGDVVTLQLPKGEVKMKIVKIEYPS